MLRERIIGRYTGKKKGPLLIVFGCMHGNEPAGYYAIDLMLKMLEVEPITNPEFEYKGRMLGIIGNTKAFDKRIRFFKQDLNRSWTTDNISKIENSDIKTLNSEEQELFDIIKVIKKEIKEYQPKKVFVLDLHTTSSTGGIFTIVPNINDSIKIAMELNAPVILGLLKGVHGTSTEYFDEKALGVPTVSLSFESGNHNDILSVNRAIAALTNLAKIIGSVDGKHIENRHNALLEEFSNGLPKISKLIYTHKITPKDKFKMKPGFQNFQKISAGEVLAEDKNGIITSKFDGRILMPLYQKQGEDGFFIIKEVDNLNDFLKNNI